MGNTPIVAAGGSGGGALGSAGGSGFGGSTGGTGFNGVTNLIGGFGGGGGGNGGGGGFNGGAGGNFSVSGSGGSGFVNSAFLATTANAVFITGVQSGNGLVQINSVPAPNAVPTPALLSGLIGLGVAALRKRKPEKVEAEV